MCFFGRLAMVWDLVGEIPHLSGMLLGKKLHLWKAATRHRTATACAQCQCAEDLLKGDGWTCVVIAEGGCAKMASSPPDLPQTPPRQIRPSNRLRSVANFQTVNAPPCVSKRPKTRYRRPVCRQRPVLAAKNRN